MWRCLLVCRTEVWSSTGPRRPGVVPGLRCRGWRPTLSRRGRVLRLSCRSVVKPRDEAGACSALALLVAQVLADHHDPAVPPDHLALVADLLDARLDLHRPAVCSWLVMVWCWSCGYCRWCLVLVRGDPQR